MIGQERNKAIIKDLVDNNSFPRFLIVEGKKGQGKHEICRYIADKLSIPCVFFNNKVDSVRNMISLAYTQSNPILYCVEDCQDMSVNAKNSLLKICEEPCEMAYIALLTTNDSLLETLKSRAITIKLTPYSIQDKKDYLSNKDVYIDPKVQQYILEIAENMGQIEQLLQMSDVKEFVGFVNKVTNGIDKANIGNALKITTSLKLKQDGEGYDPILFLQTLKFCLYEQAQQEKDKMFVNYKKINIINKSIYQLMNKGYNSQAILDCMVISLREA